MLSIQNIKLIRIFTLFILFFQCTFYVTANNCNLVENGNFENALDDWVLYQYGSASGNLSFEANGFCKVNVINGSTSSWHLALRQNNVNLELGKTYQVSFDAYADASRNISVILSDQNGNQYAYHSQGLTTVANNYTFSFVMNNLSDINSVLNFNTGNSSINTFFDNIIVKEIDCIEQSNCNILENGSFENNLAPWNLFTYNNSLGNITLEASGYCKIEVVNGSTNAWHLALRQTGITLQNGQSYEISYDAYAAANRNASVTITDVNGYQYNYISQSLTTTSQNYINTFVMNDATDNNALFSFNVGNSSTDVYIDNIIIKELNCEAGNCEANLNITNDLNIDETYQANYSIACNTNINANVNFKAGQEIIFDSNFFIEANYNLNATIESCSEDTVINNCSQLFSVASTSTIEYESTNVCNVSDGISGMWISRANQNVYWHIADHDYNLHDDDNYLFAVSASGNLLWSGKLSGVNFGNKDIEAITGFKQNNVWYLALWENRWPHDEIQIITEPSVSENQSLIYDVTIPVEKIISPQEGIGEAGNVESLTWDESDDNMYLVERGGDTFNNSPTQAVSRIPNFSSLNDGAMPNEIFVANIQGRPSEAASNVHVGVGDACISSNGDVLIMIGVGGTGSNKNEYMFWWTRDVNNESWADVLNSNPIPNAANSISTESMGENVALSPTTNAVFYGNDWASGANNKIYKNNVSYQFCD